MSAKYFFFDVETTGLDADTCEIISFAAILLDNDLKEVAALNALINPVNGCPPEAARVNGYTPEKWKTEGAIPAGEFYPILKDFLKGTYRLSPVGHNVSFDLAFLKAYFKEHGDQPTYNQHFNWHALDTMGLSITFDIAKIGHKAGRYGLGKLCERYGISLGEEAHDAKADIRATVELFRYLVLAIRGEAEVIAPPAEVHAPKGPMLIKEADHWKFTRGKYEDKTIEQVAILEYDYIRWMIDKFRDIDDDMRAALKAAL